MLGPGRLLSCVKWLSLGVAISTGVPVLLSFVLPIEWHGRQPNVVYSFFWGVVYREHGDVIFYARDPVCSLPLRLYLCPLAAGVISAVCWLAGPKRPVKGHCSSCGYDLTGNVSGTCPECGTPVPGREQRRAPTTPPTS